MRTPPTSKMKTVSRPRAGAALAVVVDADAPDRDVLQLLVDARPPLLVGGQAADDARLVAVTNATLL